MNRGGNVMSVEVYFSRPGQVSEIKDRIINDIKHAKRRLLVAQYTLTDDLIRNALVSNTNIIEKKLILNQKEGDLNNLHYVILGCKGNPIYSNMHHKFLIVDDTVWVGSFNMTPAASEKNWENILRITDQKVVEKFVEEFKKMYMYARCIPAPDMYADYTYLFSNIGYIKCINGCSSEIGDIFNHFQPIYYTEMVERNYMENMKGNTCNTKVLKEKNTLPLHLTSSILKCKNEIQSVNGTCSYCRKTRPVKDMSILNVNHKNEEYNYENPSHTPVNVSQNSSAYFYCTECLYDYLKSVNII